MTIRPAGLDDVDAVAAVWHAAWADGHAGNVPDALYEYRSDVDGFRERVPERIASTAVALDDAGAVIAFVTVHDDELEQLFVLRSARGSGVAAQLLRTGESMISEAGHDTAWLAVVAGNARARCFYERQGWHDAGDFEYAAQIPSGTVIVPCHRYVKEVRS